MKSSSPKYICSKNFWNSSNFFKTLIKLLPHFVSSKIPSIISLIISSGVLFPSIFSKNFFVLINSSKSLIDIPFSSSPFKKSFIPCTFSIFIIFFKNLIESAFLSYSIKKGNNFSLKLSLSKSIWLNLFLRKSIILFILFGGIISFKSFLKSFIWFINKSSFSIFSITLKTELALFISLLLLFENKATNDNMEDIICFKLFFWINKNKAFNNFSFFSFDIFNSHSLIILFISSFIFWILFSPNSIKKRI